MRILQNSIDLSIDGFAIGLATHSCVEHGNIYRILSIGIFRLIVAMLLVIFARGGNAIDLNEYRTLAASEQQRTNQLISMAQTVARLNQVLFMENQDWQGCIASPNNRNAINEVTSCIIVLDKCVLDIRTAMEAVPIMKLEPIGKGEAALRKQADISLKLAKETLTKLESTRASLRNDATGFVDDATVCKPAMSYVSKLEALRPDFLRAINTGDVYFLRGTLATVESYAAAIRVGQAICANDYMNSLSAANAVVGDLRKIAEAQDAEILFQRGCQSVGTRPNWASICLSPRNVLSEYALHTELIK
ncbi:hypothetical protein [Caballeronia sp. LZ035]|uniref:hypothetical protein n=1 Tax=Caballeronia sp. LZ035 TaxID=3038568 RepID=UPI002859B5D5|nr:hypothetical protein [Caballeronia sp. LZ035]MDR5759404.1 hypothetical protein [Caballeronia sp. LZ035]